MIRIEFTKQMVGELHYERYHHPHPKVQRKMEVLYLKSRALAHQEIRRLCNISKTTLTIYLKQYLAGGIERLKRLDYQGQPSELNQHVASVETYFRANPPQTIKEAQAKIQEITGIHRSPNQVRDFLNRIGMNRCKVGFVPGKSGNSEKFTEQETFRAKVLEPLLASAKAGEKAVFCRCCSFCPHDFFRLPLVLYPVVHPVSIGTQAV